MLIMGGGMMVIEEQKKMFVRKRKEMEKKCRIACYFDQNQLDLIYQYSIEIGSCALSNTVRNIVVKYLQNRTSNRQPFF